MDWDNIISVIKGGLTKVATLLNGGKPYTTFLYVIMFIIIIALFITLFSKKTGNLRPILNAYSALTLMFAIYSFLLISTDLISSEKGGINYGYIVSFLINAVLGMGVLYTVGKMGLFIASIAFFILTLLFIVFITNPKESDDLTAAQASNMAEQVGSSPFLKFCEFEADSTAFQTKLKQIWNYLSESDSTWLYPFKFIWSLISIIVMIPIWTTSGLFKFLRWAFDSILGASSSSNNTTYASSSTFDKQKSEIIHWVGMLILFMLVVLILFSSQSAMRKKPIATFGIGIVAAIAYLAYVRFNNSGSFTNKFIGVIGALFVLYLYLYNPYDVFHKMTGINLFGIFLLFVGLCGMIYMVSNDSASAPTAAAAAGAPKTMSDSLKKMFVDNYKGLLKGFFGLTISIAFIMFLVATISKLQSSDNNPTAGIYILNILIVVGMLTILFNVLDAKYKLRDNVGFKLLVELILYIPCLLSDVADLLMSEYYKTKYFTLILVILEIIFIVFYWVIYEKIVSKVYTGGGKVLINEPVSLNTSQTVGYYRSLSGSTFLDYEKSPINAGMTNADGAVFTSTNTGAFSYSSSDTKGSFNAVSGKPMYDENGNPVMMKDVSGNYLLPTKVNTYKFGISCWVYLNLMPSNGATPLTILDYGSNPTVSYSPQKNELTVNVIKEDGTCSASSSRQTIAVYTNKNPPIQKWFNLVLNYDGGHLDVFLDSKLVQTSTDVISCVKYDALVIGQANGLNAKLCNLIYFKTPLDIITVHNMYNITKIEETPDIPKRDLFSI